MKTLPYQLVCFFLLLFFNCFLAGAQNKEPSQSHLSIGSNFIKEWKGEKFFQMDLKDLEGKQVSTESLKGKISVINFWFIQCKPCVTEMPELNKLVKKYKEKNVLFIAPTFNNKEDLQNFVQKYQFDYRILPEAKDLVEGMELRIYPTHLVIDKNGTIKEIIIGGSEDIYNKLDALIAKELSN